MSNLEQAINLLFPNSGPRARDVKFSYESGATVENMAQQIIVCYESMQDDTKTIHNIDNLV